MAHELQVETVHLVDFTLLDVVDQLLVQVLFIFLVALDPLGDLVAHVLIGLVGDFFLLLVLVILLLLPPELEL